MPLTVSILTPEAAVLERRVESVVVPAYDGELGILQNHAPLIAQLAPGAVRLTVEGKTDLFAIAGGFVEVLDNKVSIFAESAELAHEIDVERAHQAAERARQALRQKDSNINVMEAEASLQRALARLHVVEALRTRRRTPQNP